MGHIFIFQIQKPGDKCGNILLSVFGKFRRRTIEIQQASATGPLSGTCTLPDTSSWTIYQKVNDETVVITIIQNVLYLQ